MEALGESFLIAFVLGGMIAVTAHGIIRRMAKTVLPVEETTPVVKSTPPPPPGYRDSAKSNDIAGVIEVAPTPKWKFRKYTHTEGGHYGTTDNMYVAERTADGKQFVTDHGHFWYAVDTGVEADSKLGNEISGAFKVAQLMDKINKSKNKVGEPIGGV